MRPRPNLPTLNEIRRTHRHAAEAFDEIADTIGTLPSYSDLETPSGPVDGKNTIFTVKNAPNPASSVHFYVSGLIKSVSSVKGTAITLASAPAKGATLQVSYRY